MVPHLVTRHKGGTWSGWPRFALGIGKVAFFVVLTDADPSVTSAGSVSSGHLRQTCLNGS
jgi:hypothetical protein